MGVKGLIMVLFTILFAVPTFGGAADQSRVQTATFELHYRFDRPELDLDYLNNRRTAELLKDHLINTARLDSVIAYVSSSPDGQHAYNILLARRRAVKAEGFIRDLLSERADDAQDIAVKTVVMDENWSGLLKLIEEDYFRHDRDKVLEILRRENVGKDARKELLSELDNGKTWGYILWKYMPQLRNATIITLKLKPVAPLPQIEPLSTNVPAVQGPSIVNPSLSQPALQPEDSPAGHQTEIPVSPGQPSDQPAQAGHHEAQPLTALCALRTNLLVPALNIGAEVSLGERWSVSADYYYPWIWPSKMNRNCFELLGWSVEGRYWFGRDRQPQQRLRGHSVGLYAAAGYYDFERNYQGQQGEFVSTGLDYTYAMGIGRRKRLNLEFTLALGYIRSWGRNYTVPGPGGELYPEPGTVIFDYVGPTKAAVSLVVPFEKWPWTKAAMTGKTKAGKTRKEGRR